MGVSIFGIRHHGPGCARSLRNALAELRPDLVLVEGPPDAQDEVAAITMDGMTPPVALLIHEVEDPRRATFYPFAEFSPEWQALRWAVANGVSARFFDLPCALRPREPEADGADQGAAGGEPAHRDPLSWLAEADGYSDGERWWNDRIEESSGDRQLFAAILEGVTALRAELALEETLLDRRREAWMRRALREAQKEGSAEIAVVCGAWHAPALAESSKAADDALLKGLAKVKVRATWVPWTYERLTRASGYGAGIVSPGWYESLWRGGADLTERWLVQAARALRAEDLEASSASVIEAVRLSEALAGLRGRPLPGLPETLQAVRAVLCGGEDAWFPLLQRDVLVGRRLGEVPEGLARLPLEEDLRSEQRSLRLKPTAGVTAVELDLREPGGRARSTFLNRLLALRIPWGTRQDAKRARGTFKEVWALQWKPELAIAVVDAAAFGNTVEAAAGNRLAREAHEASGLPELIALLESALLADLASAGAAILAAVQAAAATTGDTLTLLDSIEPLCRLVRYGNVRDSDQAAVRAMVRGLVLRAHIGLLGACSGLDDEAAQKLSAKLRLHDAAVALLEDADLRADELHALHRVADLEPAHAQMRGVAVSLLRDAKALGSDAVATHIARQLSAGALPASAAAWLEGFLAGSGTLLAHEHELLLLLDRWVTGLADDHFQNVLPIVRRTFGTFSGPERRQIAAALHARAAGPGPRQAAPTLDLDARRAAPAVRAVAELLGLPSPEVPE